ncbi:unnamed protein product [Brassica oleracea]|uniref:Uncharacterized protein n=1 Tax=Brassica oleracea TaxID=3712 RepID=A0A3P6FTK5_BRAOL|nr:unnamed protein product [Brassica oleracea]
MKANPLESHQRNSLSLSLVSSHPCARLTKTSER